MWLFLELSAAFMLLSTSSAEEYVPPTINPGLKDKYMYKSGDNILLPCAANGEPEPTIFWRKNSEPLNMSPANVRQDKGDLIIDQTGANDEGFYQCVATNPFGTAISDVTHLVLAKLGKHVEQDKTQVDIEVGQKVKFDCEKIISVPPAIYSWSIVDNPRSTGDGTPVVLSDRVQQDPEGNLYFANFQEDDYPMRKLYRCNTFNGLLGTSTSGNFVQIDLIDDVEGDIAPKLEYPEEGDVAAIKGKTLELRCIFSGKPTPRLTWSVDLTEDRYTIQDFNTTLRVIQIQDGDEGIYECQADNGVNGVHDFQYKVRVESIPTFMDRDNQPMNKVYDLDDETVWQCASDAKPSAKVTWYVNGEPLDAKNPGEGRTLTNDGLDLHVEKKVCSGCEGNDTSNLMTVQCIAANTHGRAFAHSFAVGGDYSHGCVLLPAMWKVVLGILVVVGLSNMF